MQVDCIDPRRTRVLKEGVPGSGPVVYWMSRDQRTRDNWALLYAAERAQALRVPLAVIICLVPHFLNATIRQYSFMLKNLESVGSTLAGNNISLHLLFGNPALEIPRWTEDSRVAELVTDFDPLAIKSKWKNSVVRAVSMQMTEVDAHNLIPCWLVSPKQEWGAYTIRPKIRRLIGSFLENYPPLPMFPPGTRQTMPDWAAVLHSLPVNRAISGVTWIKSGEEHAESALHSFITSGLERYQKDRNNPALPGGQSNLSPYLHFGQLSAQRIALEMARTPGLTEAKEVFLEELIVRRELADNFCYYNPRYDTFQGFPEWAKQTLDAHRGDPRPYLYSLEQLEQGITDDDLWNAAQREMVIKGKMHGYMRMYWAKKILEWTESPEQAMEFAISLNDTYELDGRDPNGYAGIAWSIGGVHDRAWGQRPVFGKVRYMSYNGLKTKFDVNAYCKYVASLSA